MKKGTVPGPDRMVIELYQHAPEVFVKQVTKIIGKACESNSFPQEWMETIQIPKKARPQSVNNYRKISICNTGYRIYATYLLKLLDEEIEAIGNYLAAFMRYRSTEDHIFVIRRILDEKWKTVGLKLNETKTKMLVRDPINKSIAKQTQEINGVLITPVDTIKYLGTYLTSELSHRDTIKARCKQAIRNAKGLIPFIKKTKMQWKIARMDEQQIEDYLNRLTDSGDDDFASQQKDVDLSDVEDHVELDDMVPTDSDSDHDIQPIRLPQHHRRSGVILSSDSETEEIPVMSRERFDFLLNCLRFDDKSTRDERKAQDKFAPIREWWEVFIQICRDSYKAGSYLTIDEQLLGFRGRCPFRMYIPSKPNNNRNVTMDNWFTSVPLALELLQAPYKCTIVGTLRANKREIPPELLQIKERPIGSSVFVMTGSVRRKPTSRRCFVKNVSEKLTEPWLRKRHAMPTLKRCLKRKIAEVLGETPTIDTPSSSGTQKKTDISVLQHHSAGKKHQTQAKSMSKQQPISKLFQTSKILTEEEKAKYAELKLAAFMAEYKISHASMDHLSDLQRLPARHADHWARSPDSQSSDADHLTRFRRYPVAYVFRNLKSMTARRLPTFFYVGHF
ncbi:hypothetical protein EVAR_6870_1 [Eumeta japonica]|uniref:PiggyBac transposable element-derived protein domain-containing protein n=1 Tax=Eumeta variegata TaxID=151549 RepID=A0A4C1TH41_EUMVA|nr:hypothetical protein EVAR_6870_1 [Eumeta japonica]